MGTKLFGAQKIALDYNLNPQEKNEGNMLWEIMLI